LEVATLLYIFLCIIAKALVVQQVVSSRKEGSSLAYKFHLQRLEDDIFFTDQANIDILAACEPRAIALLSAIDIPVDYSHGVGLSTNGSTMIWMDSVYGTGRSVVEAALSALTNLSIQRDLTRSFGFDDWSKN